MRAPVDGVPSSERQQVANLSPFTVPLCITLYSKITPAGPSIVMLKAPSPSNLQPMNDHNRKIRFGEFTFTKGSPPQSPRKKARTSLDDTNSPLVKIWKEGV